MKKAESMEKDILTKEQCIKDLMGPKRLFPTVLLFPLLYALLGGFEYLVLRLNSWVTLVDTVLIGVCVIILTVLFYKILRDRRRLKKGRIRIVQDTLTRSVRDEFYTLPIPQRFESGLRDLLIFSKYGKYFIMRTQYYKWSKQNAMRAGGVYNTSLVGDTFYLVIYTDDKKEKPVMVYNTKFFELKEDEK